MKLVQKGVTRVTLTAADLLDAIQKLGFTAKSGSVVQILITNADATELLAELMRDHVITVQFTEDQKEEDYGASRRNN